MGTLSRSYRQVVVITTTPIYMNIMIYLHSAVISIHKIIIHLHINPKRDLFSFLVSPILNISRPANARPAFHGLLQFPPSLPPRALSRGKAQFLAPPVKFVLYTLSISLQALYASHHVNRSTTPLPLLVDYNVRCYVPLHFGIKLSSSPLSASLFLRPLAFSFRSRTASRRTTSWSRR